MNRSFDKGDIWDGLYHGFQLALYATPYVPKVLRFGKAASTADFFISETIFEGQADLSKIIKSSARGMDPSRTYTAYNKFGVLQKFGVTDAGLDRLNQVLLDIGDGSYADFSNIMPKYQAHTSEKYLRSLHYASTDQYFLNLMKKPYPVNFSTGKPVKPPVSRVPVAPVVNSQ